MLFFVKIVIMLASVISLFAVNACASVEKVESDPYFEASESDRLSKAELATLIISAQRFVSESRSVKLRDEQRMIIRNTHPQVDVIYTAHKFGRLTFRWDIGHGIFVQLTARGRLDTPRPNWKLDKVYSTVDSETDVPEGAKTLD